MISAVEPFAVAPPPEERSATILQFLHQLLHTATDTPRPLPDLLAALARAFAARSAGLAAPLDRAAVVRLHVREDGQPDLLTQFPWDSQPDLLDRVCRSAGAVPVRLPGGHWLCTAVWPPGAPG